MSASASPFPPGSALPGLAARLRTRRQLRRLARLPTARGRSVRFAVLGDVEPCRFWLLRRAFNRPGVFVEQLRALQERPIAFAFQLGDMVERGQPRRYERFLRELRREWSGKPYLTTPGNHDRSRPNGPSDSALYRALFGPANYRFDHAGARFLSLDTSARGLRRRQLRWLERALHFPGRKVIFTHMPPVQLRLWGGRGRAHAVGGFTRGAREFCSILSKARVDRVYMGHVHAFGVEDYLGVRYVLTGGGGSALFPSGAPDRFHHFLEVEAGPEGLRETVHAASGERFDIPASPVLLGRR